MRGKREGKTFHPLIEQLSKAARDLSPFVAMAEEVGIRFEEARYQDGCYTLSPAVTPSGVRELTLSAQILQGVDSYDVRCAIHLYYFESTWQHRLVYQVRLSRCLSERNAWDLNCWCGAGTPHVDAGTKESLRRLGITPMKAIEVGASKGRKLAREMFREYSERVLVPRNLIHPVVASTT
jgi:hypothetical protein